jgi:hypothetical protein
MAGRDASAVDGRRTSGPTAVARIHTLERRSLMPAAERARKAIGVKLINAIRRICFQRFPQLNPETIGNIQQHLAKTFP